MKTAASIVALSAALAACDRGPRAELSEPGSELYTYHCSACHGALGEGDGPVAEVMNVSVPNLRTLSQRNGGTFPLDVAAFIDGRDLPVAHGDRYMPIWGSVFSSPEAVPDDGNEDEVLVARRIEALVAFLERIQNP
jgi:mono/diheme cytochrome c family protein